MSTKSLAKNSLEILETRIAPAALLPSTDDKYVQASFNAPVEVRQGEVLNTTGDANSGTYLLFMEKGNALVFFTDLNNNSEVDFNEITGISVGDGARIVLFADVHGDIVTNLKETTTTVLGTNGQPKTITDLSLSDSDNNAANDPGTTPGDGRVLLNKRIEKIELRSLRATDLIDQNNDGRIDDADVALRKAPTTYSIFGNIYAGKGFGATDGGLIIDTTGLSNFGFEDDTVSMIGSIKTGTAASGQFFSFGVSRADNISGTITSFVPPVGQAGGDIIGVKALDPQMRFNLNGLYAGDGGLGARGGNIVNVTVNADDTGGYEIIAGSGGRGPTGGAGGSIISFADLGSQTSQVVIRSGDGGTGTAGAGGNGGTFDFRTFNIRGNVNLKVGDGGDGFAAGGNGASLARGNFTQPNFSDFTISNGIGSTHLGSSINWEDGTDGYTANIGLNQAIDFDKDGFGDFVFTTRDTSQVVVMFGNGLGGFRTKTNPDGTVSLDRYYLSGIRNPEALTVADVNGDGVLDVITASSDAGAHSGIAVFLGKFEDMDGELSGSEDLNHNGRNDFLGFSDVRFSALPLLENYLGWDSPQQISSIVVGDFNGDGRPELAAVTTVYNRKQERDGVTIGLTEPRQVLLFLQQDVERNNITGQMELTGQFFADFGTKGSSSGGVVIPAAPEIPYFQIPNAGDAESGKSQPTVIIEASALSTSSDHDVVFVGVVGQKVVRTVDFADRTAAPVVAGTFSLGRVDTDRELAEPGNAHRNPEDVTLLDFAVFDYGTGDDSGVADIAVISQSPALYLVGVKGTGLGGGSQTSGDGTDNSGNFFGDKGYNIVNGELLAIRAVDGDADGFMDDVAIHATTGPRPSEIVATLEYQEGVLNPGPTANPTTQATGAILRRTITTDTAEVPGFQAPGMFAVYYPDATDMRYNGYATADNDGVDDIYFNARLAPLPATPTNPNPLPRIALPSLQPFIELGLRIQAGDGGDAIVGNGGKGGSFGGGSQLRDVTRTITDDLGNTVDVTVKELVGSLNFTVSGEFRMVAGIGGDGFANGGDGGDISGVVVRQRNNDNIALSSSMVTGTGGRGVAGVGGHGGDVVGSSLDGISVILVTGDGGQGDRAGNGGTVRGNGTVVYDARATFLEVRAGNGGNGASRGGLGGSVVNYSPQITQTIEDVDTGGVEVGSLAYYAGNGGNSAAGPGGNGGSLVNSSPRLNAFIDQFVYLYAGNGGNGTSGGNGGTVSGFLATLDADSKNPAEVAVVAGHGGAGLAGRGGEGGDLVGIKVPSRGLFSFNRVIAGNGGSSAAGVGGNGGDVARVTTGSVEGSVAVAAGAGGHGLTLGGRGGNVSNLVLSLGGTSTLTKGLVVAGAGGDAYAFIPNPKDGSTDQALKAFGGTIGRGGAGGNINGVSQAGNQGAHADLIAGDGGSTINYGTVFDTRSYVGIGGSVSNITLSGNAGNIARDNQLTEDVDENVEIKGYNNLLGGETMARYVESKLRFGLDNLTDADGNVGIVVGSAGKNKAVQLNPLTQPNVYTSLPATGSRNGSMINVTVNNLMAAVAGSVDRIAEIQVIKNLNVINGVVGADKGSFLVDPKIDPALPDPQTGDLHKGVGTVGPDTRDYLDKDLNTLTNTRGPVSDGALIDGAVVAKVVLDSRGRVVTIPGRVF